MNNNRKLFAIKDLQSIEEIKNFTILTEDGGSFKVHLEIMALFSNFFKQICLNSDRKSSPDKVISGISKEIMSTIIDFAYSNKLMLRHNKIRDLIHAAEFLKIPALVDVCKRFLESNLSVANCINIYALSNIYSYSDVQNKAQQLMVQHFEEIHTTNLQYLSLPLLDLTSLLSSDTLNVRSEESVYWAILKWTEHDISRRSEHLPSLLRFALRIGLCDPEFFNKHILTNPLMKDNEDFQHYLFQVFQMFEDIQSQDENTRMNIFDINHPFLRPRVPNIIIFAMGGWSTGSATSMMETFDVKTRRWFPSNYPDDMERAYHGMIWNQGLMYVIGGFNGYECFNNVRCFDPVSHVWEERGCMYDRRCYVSVAALGKHIYAMGGYDGVRRKKTCEKYDPDSNQWMMVSSMLNIRSDASADSLDGKIYIVGGFNGIEVLSSVECYNPETDKWTEMRRMHSPRSGVKMVAFQGYLYAMGGFDGMQRLETVERYDPMRNTWTYAAPMLAPRSNFAVSILEGLIYVIGGFNGFGTIATVEIYDPQKNSWSQTTDLNLNRSALAACSVSNISTADEYCYTGYNSCNNEVSSYLN